MSDRRQRQKEARAAKRLAQKKAAQRKELYRRLLTALGFGVVVIAIFVVPGLLESEEGTLPTGYEGFREQATACGAEQPPAEQVLSFDAPEEQGDITSGSEVTAVIATSCGEIVLELDPANYPETVNSFVFLAREGFYNGQIFHRVAADFVIQGGDPEANGTGGPGYRIPNEFPGDGFVFEPGVVAMANAGSGTTGSQFFIVIGEDAQFLTPSFNVLGRVVNGTDTLDRISQVPTGTGRGTVEKSLPLESVYIEDITITVSGS